jgi:hypothetical protein
MCEQEDQHRRRKYPDLVAISNTEFVSSAALGHTFARLNRQLAMPERCSSLGYKAGSQLFIAIGMFDRPSLFDAT